MAERAKKEAELGRKLSGSKPSAETARRARPSRANTTDPHSRIIATGSRGVLQGYNAQAAATVDQVVLAAEVTVTTNDQPHFVPMATAVAVNLTKAGHHAGVGAFVADAGYWTAANGTVDVGAEVLIATRKTAWRKADKPRLSSFLCKRLLILCWGPGSSALNGVPVLAAVKPGRWVGHGRWVDRGCAPAGLAGMEEPRGARPPAGHKVTSSRPGKARLSAP